MIENMIIDHINNASQYRDLNKHLVKAFEFIENGPELKAGRNEIDGDDLFVMYVDGENRLQADARLEAHQQYLDLHYTIEGSESMGWIATHECTQEDKPYDEENDVALFQDEPRLLVDILPKHFCIVWPGDAHMPMVGEPGSSIKKLVFKIKI
jgi:biofilm protein TabA